MLDNQQLFKIKRIVTKAASSIQTKEQITTILNLLT